MENDGWLNDESRDHQISPTEILQDEYSHFLQEYDPSSDIIPPLDVDPSLSLENQLRAAVLHVLKDRIQKGGTHSLLALCFSADDDLTLGDVAAVAFGFGFLLHRLDPVVRKRLDSEANVNPDFITATPYEFLISSAEGENFLTPFAAASSINGSSRTLLNLV
jgi:hypothetical protein